MSFFQIVSIFSDNMGYFFFMFGIPLYLRKFHGLGTEDVSIRKIIINSQNIVPKMKMQWLQIGYLDAIPFIVASVFAFIFANLADWLIITNKMSITHTRKFANHFCLMGTALGFAGLCFVGCNYVIAEVVIVLMVTANATSMSGYMVNISKYVQSNDTLQWIH